MKISQLAAICKVPKDTIQYYTRLGLLIPQPKGNSNDFTEREVEDLRYIQKLKAMHFPIRDIQYIVRIRRLSNWNEPETFCDYLNLLHQRTEALDTHIAELQDAKALVQKEIAAINTPVASPRRLGVPVDALKYLVCPRCHSPLHLADGDFTYPYVFGGRLSCTCGYHAEIADGIIDTGNRYNGSADSPDLQRALYKGLPDSFYRCFHTCADRFLTRMDALDLSGKLVMEMHVNGYFFLYNHFKMLKNDCTYVIIDKYIETIQMYKKLIELLDSDMNILFIADASVDFPLRDGCVNLLINFFGENEHQLYFKNFLIDDVARYLAPGSEVLGTLLSLPSGSKSLRMLHKKYPESGKDAFCDKCLREYYQGQDGLFQWEALDGMDKTPNNFSFSCHVDGEPLSISYYHAKRHG
ncbi:MAG TPA: MerR family transcriptional regulator [Clostridia bacterium]|nr:MerR family transcriptional regulator [Clostridia bacterium]